MSYRNKTYIAFDGDNDMKYYRTMQMWKENEKIDFNFFDAHDINSARDTSLEESIKARLRERMANAKQMILLVGEKTKFLRKFVAWEIELARKKNIPIIVVNLNGKRSFDDGACPSSVKDGICTVHIQVSVKIIKYALDYFPEYYYSQGRINSHDLHYTDKTYQSLGYAI